jgi:hypothetical protein
MPAGVGGPVSDADVKANAPMLERLLMWSPFSNENLANLGNDTASK